MKKYSGIKTFLLFCVIAVTLTLVSFSSFASHENVYDFSNFSEKDSMDFVVSHNIEIPTKLLESDNIGNFTKTLIMQSSNSPNIEFCFNYDKTQQYAEDIKSAVHMYMNWDAVPAIASTNSYYLQYNTVMDEYGNWVTSGGYFNPKWYNYNCYAYAINRAEQPQYYSSGNYIQYQPGNMCGQGSFDDCTNISELANIVVADLQCMGYEGISVSSTVPSISASQELICVRMSEVDYHFMRYDTYTGAWYHKPGNTSVLKYNYVPANDMLWYIEYSSADGEGYSPYYPYDSSVLYIVYTKNSISVNNNDVSCIKSIQAGKDVLFELYFAYSGKHKITFNSTYPIKYEIYNEDFDILFNDLGNSFSANFNAGKHYLRINFDSYTGQSNVEITLHKHDYVNNYVQLNGIQHKAYCVCGSFETETHHISYCRPMNNDLHYVYCECGYLIETDTHSMVIGWKPGTSTCRKCGYIRDDSGLGNVIMGDEDEMEND